MFDLSSVILCPDINLVISVHVRKCSRKSSHFDFSAGPTSKYAALQAATVHSVSHSEPAPRNAARLRQAEGNGSRFLRFEVVRWTGETHKARNGVRTPKWNVSATTNKQNDRDSGQLQRNSDHLSTAVRSGAATTLDLVPRTHGPLLAADE